MKKMLILILALIVGGCSLSDSRKDTPVVRADDLEFAVDTFDTATVSSEEDISVKPEKIAETKIPDEYQAPPVEEVAMVEPQEPKFEEFANSQPAESQRVEATEPEMAVAAEPEKIEVPQEIVIIPSQVPEKHEIAKSGIMEDYRVQKGDTLMLVAFKIYGDYRKWKDLAVWNKDKLKTKISEGTILKYYVPDEKFGWSPVGLPHLVKTGETLGIISMDKYGTPKKWKAIYENNRPLIRNPNLIFAGFTLYYQPTRELASKPR